MSDSIQVAIKVRPLIKRERDENLPIQWSVQGNTIALTDSELKKRGDGRFCFDHIFDTNASNTDVFNSIVRPIVDAAVNGFNGTVFAYGQTSSGKTYTMMGTLGEPGVIPQAIEHMFNAITNTAGREFLLRVSYLEIYKEKVNDLLNNTGVHLKLKEDTNGQVFLQCKEEITNCPENMLSIMKKGDKNRRTGETNMNERSSRSHTIFRITIESRAAGDSDSAIQVSQLNLVDLAGSERARQTGATGERFKEGLHINLSLMTLGLVIKQLSDCQDGQKHVNFRDSKLTRLLQNSLGGNALTTIICAVTPAAVEETQCTLSFACRAKSVKNKPHVNEVMSDAALLKRYAKQISKLQTELDKIKQENRVAEVEEMESKLQEKERVNQMLEERIELLKTRIVSGDITEEDTFKFKAKRRQTWGGPGLRKGGLSDLPDFQRTQSLSTPKQASHEKSCRKSIIQSVDMMNQTFQTAFTDFELELFKSECDRNNEENGSDSEDEKFITKRRHRVTFKDEVFTIEWENSISPERMSGTPVRLNRNTATQTINCESPSTPKHVLRKCIHHLTKEFIELRQFTTLEKQLLSEDDGVKKLEETTPRISVPEYTQEVKKRLESLNLAEETNAEHVIAELCSKIGEFEKQNILEREASRKAMKQSSELERKMKNITSERDEFEYMSSELRAQLKKKTVELELKNMSEESVKEVELKKISELESKLKNVTLENTQLRAESTKRITELQKEVENIVSERKEFDLIRRELCNQLNMKSLELDKLKNDPEAANVEMTAHLQQLEKRAEQIASENAVMEQTIVDLRAELSRVSSDAESRIISERTAHEETCEKVSRLQKQVEDLASKGNELERVNVDLNARLDQNILQQLEKRAEQIASEKAVMEQTIVDLRAELSRVSSDAESRIVSERTAHEETCEKVCRLQKQVEDLASKGNELERVNVDLNARLDQNILQQLEKRAEQIESEKAVMEQTIVDLRAELSRVSSDAESRIVSERTAHEETCEKVSRLQKQVEDLASKGNELERVNVDLNARLDQNILDFESKIAAEQTARQDAANRNTELQEQLNSLIVEKQQLEASNVELSKTVSEFESAMKSDHVARQETIEKLSVLQKEVESVTLEKNALKETLELKTTELESRAALHQNVVEKMSELEKRVADVIATKTELEETVSSLRTEREETLNKISELEKQVEGVTTRKDELEHENRQLVEKLKKDDNLVSEDNQSVLSYSRQYNDSTFDTSALMLGTEKSQLEESLYLKSQEVNEIKCDVQSLRQDIENLQETIYLLTTENKDMAEKLTTERENAKQLEANLQKTIDELYDRISDVTNQKIALESNLATLNDQLESMRSRGASAKIVSNDEELFAVYKNKIDMLTAENIELSTSIAEKNKELESIKESKSLLFDHECMYKEKAVALAERNECLRAENDELSTDLIDKIEENDELKEQCEILKKKMEESLPKNEASTEGNADNLQLQNSMLKVEIIELNTKVTTLSKENAKFSNDLLQAIEDLESSRLEKFDVGAETSCKESLQEKTHDVPTLTDKVATLEEKVNQLTRLNKKLSDLKLTSCNQCAHLKNLNESRRTLKLEAKALNQKLEDLQRKFDRKCEDTEILKNKINQEFSTSGRELSPNVSFVDEMNVSFVEERVRTLNDELQTMKADHDKLTVLYENKCSELEQICSNVSMDQLSGLDVTPKKRSEKNSCRLVQIQSHIDQLKTDIDEMRKNSTNFAATLNQFRTEKAGLLERIDGLRASNEELEQKLSTNENIATEKIQVLENELSNISKELEQLSDREKTLQSQRLTLEMELEELKIERDNKSAMIESLRNDLDLVTSQKDQLIANSMDNRYREELEASKRQHEELNQQAVARIDELQKQLVQREHLCEELQEKGVYVEQLYQQSEQEKRVLMERLQMVEDNLESNFEARYKDELESISAQYQHRVEETESNLRMLNDTLNKYVDENLNLKQELTKLKNIEEKQSESASSKQRIDDIERLSGELSDIRLCIMKELKSLKCTVNSAELSKQSVNEIFLILLQTLVSKEQEMIKAIRERCEKDKQVLKEEIQQSADTEKRATTWSKELETEIEKLQAELTERERSQKEYENTICQKEHLLKESCRENEVLRESTRTLEAELQNLQTKFEKLYKVDNKQEEAIYVAQKREKEVQEMFKSKDLEFQSKLKAETEMHEKRINELARTVESYKTKNLELSSAVEELEANEKLLKNIIEANTIEIKKSGQSLERLSAELQQLTEAYNEANQQLAQKASHIEEISAILRNKCDTLSEYKAKLDAILPEHEVLKNHVDDQKTTIERYRQEVKAMKTENEEQLESIKDKLKAEEMKNIRLSKELNNRNVALEEELNELKEKYDELKQENAKLERKVRNSTSKIKAEAEAEELKEANKRLQSSLEGASNRVVELQEVKNQTLSQLIDTKAMYDLLLQENTKIKTTLTSYETKYNASSSSTHETKFDELLLEKNTIALELEYKKLQLTQKEKEVNEYTSQVQQLQEKNKELDEKLDEHAKIIEEQKLEIAKLGEKLHSRLTENTRISELEQKLENLNEENEKLRDQVNASQLQQLQEKNKELDAELDDYAKIIEEQNLEIAKLDEKLHSRLTENTRINELEQKLENLHEENEKLRDQVDAFKMRLQMGTDRVADDIKTRQHENLIRILRRENLDLQTKLNNSKRQMDTSQCGSDVNVSWKNDDKLKELKKKLHDLELTLVSKNGRLATLELQIQSESFPYQKKCKELEEQLLAFRNKNKELIMEINKLQRTVNDVNAWECDVCRRWRVNRKDQECQTTPRIGFCSINSGVIEDQLKIQKLEKEKILMKNVCRARTQRIKELEAEVDRLNKLTKT